MALRTRIAEEMKAALRAGERARLSTIRLLLAAIKQKEVDERGELSDAEIVGIIDRMIKQRRESIAAFDAGARRRAPWADRSDFRVPGGRGPRTGRGSSARTR